MEQLKICLMRCLYENAAHQLCNDNAMYFWGEVLELLCAWFSRLDFKSLAIIAKMIKYILYL